MSTRTRLPLPLLASLAFAANLAAQTAAAPAETSSFASAPTVPASAAPASEEVVQLDELAVTAAPDSGYMPVASSRVGPLAGKDLIDTPFSINVVTSDLIRNTQAASPDDIFKLSPVAQFSSPQTRFFSAATLRGFSTASTKRIDGIPSTSSYVNVDLEDKESVEILTGLSGFLYGPGGVGGTVNYVLKRPTAERLNRVTVGNTSGGNVYAHGDFGGPIDSKNKFGYRINVLGQDGDTAIDYQDVERQLVSGAFDWKPSEKLTVGLDASWSHYEIHGNEPYWTAAAGVDYPDAPDGDTYYGQPFSRTETLQRQLGGRIDVSITPDARIRSGAARRESEIELTAVNNTFTSSAGDYTSQASSWEYPDVTATGGFAFLDLEFDTGPVAHVLTTGYYGDHDERTNFRSSPGGWSSVTLPGGDLDDPGYVFGIMPAEPAGDKYVAGRTFNHNFIVGDDIALTRSLSVLVGLNRTILDDKTYSSTGANTTAYRKSETTPAATATYKFTERLSVYGSYMESLERGGTAPMTFGGFPLVNAGEILPPLMSEQLELGAKTRVSGVLLTAALFQIDKGLQYVDATTPSAPVYVQDGRQVHRGLEFTASGSPAERVTVVGGFTVLDASVEENVNTPALEGKTPANVAEQFAKLYAEYDVGARSGLILTGGLYYTGSQYVNALNTDEIPDFVTGDLGLRYEATVAGLRSVTRLNVSNITNEDYWLSSFYAGAPRTVRLSTSIEF